MVNFPLLDKLVLYRVNEIRMGQNLLVINFKDIGKLKKGLLPSF